MSFSYNDYRNFSYNNLPDKGNKNLMSVPVSTRVVPIHGMSLSVFVHPSL